MKLTIRSENGEKIVDLKSNLQFNTIKGEQYVFSNGFKNYVLDFKDNQQSVVLTFNVDGKSIKVELNGIVPFLQANTPDMSNPTAIVINKDINDKDVDTIVENNSFNGSEIIDRLEAIVSKPVELGNDKASNLALITDYQSLLESLGAAAAGGQAAGTQPAGGITSNGSTFSSIFSLNSDSLNGIADTDRWENLSESISTVPVETADTVATQIQNVNVKLKGVDTDVIEGENATYIVTLTDDSANPVIATEDMTVTFTYSYITAEGEDITETVNVVIPAGSSEAPVVVKTLDDDVYEKTEEFTILINEVTTTGTFQNIVVDKTPVTAVIDDEDDNNPDTPDDKKDGDKPVVSIVASDALAVEDTLNSTVAFKVSQSNLSNFDTTVLVKLDLGTVEVEDLVNTTVSYKDVNGVDVTTTVADLLSGITITIPAGTTYAPEFVFTIKDDNIYEISESLSMSVSNPTNATISTTASNATAVIDDEDDNNPDTPDDKKDGDKPVVSIVASDALAVEDTLNSTVAFKVSQSNLSNFDTTVLVKLDLGTVEVEDLVNTTVSYKDVNGVDVTTTVADLLSGITITIPAGTTYAPEFVFTIKDDNIYEISESLSMSVSNPTNATISTTASNATAVIDDEDDNNPDTPDDKKDGDKPVVSIVASDALAVEDTLNSTVAFKVSQSNLSNFDTTVLVKLDLGTVEVEDLVNTTVSYKDVNGVDVTTTVADLLSGITITIPAGTTYAPEFVFTIKDDNIYEISESLSMSVSNPTNATISTTASNATAVIDDEDDNNPDTPDDKKDGDKPVVSIVASDALAVEDTLNSTVAFKVSQSNLSNFDTTVLVKLDLGTVEVEDLVNTTVSYKDVNGVDVTTTVADLLSGITITIPAGTTYAPEFVFTIKDDNIYEISESLSMSVSNPTNATISTTASNATAVIDDEDDNNPDTPDDKKDGDKPVVSIVASDALAVEDTLNSTVAFKVSQSNLSNFDTTVLVKLDLGTVEVEDLVNTTVSYKDVNGVDVTTTVADLLSGITITIPAGTTYAPEFVFTIKDDNIYEISESLSMSVSNPTNATISTTASNATAVIDDEDDNNPDTPDDKKDGDKPVVSIVASDALAVEDTLNSTVAFKVSQSNLSNFDTTVLVKLDLGTVEVEDLVNTTVSYKDVNGVDVTTTVADLLSGITITIPAGTTYAPEFVFTIKDDNIYEISESLSMSVSNPTNATISTTASNATAVIDDEDDNNPDTPDDKKDGDKPVVSIVASDALAVEDTLNSTVAFKVSQSNLSNFDTTVLVKLDLGTVEVEDLVNTTVSYKDVNGVDVTTTVADLLSGITITIPAGTTYAPEFVFTIKDDNIYEISESLSMSVSNPTNATISTTASNATAVIDDEDDNNPDTPDDKKDGDKPVVSIVASDALAVEDTLNSTVAFKVSQSNLSNFDTTVLVKLDLGTVEVEDLVNTTVSYKDVNGVDVTTTVADLLSGITITIPAGTTYAPEFVFTIKDDNIYEISESLSMSVSNPTNATISTTASNATAVIDDEDDNNPDTPDDKKDGDKPVVSIVASDALAVEDTLNSTVAFKVSQSNLSNFDTTVLVKLDLGTVEVEDLVNTTVSYKDVNGVDVTTTVADLLSGITITIPAGTTYAPEFVFTIKDDNIYEISESLSMSVSNPTNATISTTASNATAVIDDEDDNNPDTPDDKKDGDKPVVSIVASDALAVEDTLNSTVAFKVSQSNLSNFDTTVLVKLDLGTVEVEDLVNTTVSYKDVNGVDVTTTVADLLSGITITIPAGTTYAPEFVFTIKDDNIYEISESLSMSVSNPTNATISTTASNATAVIDDEDDNNPDTPDDKKDGDKPVVSIVASDALAVEDTLNSTVAFKVSQSNLSNFDTTVLVKLDLGTVEVEDLVNTTVSYKDVNGVDVTTTVADLLSGITITIPAGTTYAPEFVFTIKDDNIYEISESLSMSVSNPTNATISTTASNATAVIDDEDDNNPDTPDDKKDGDKPVVSIVASDALAVEDTLNSTVAFKVSQSNLSNFDTTVLVKLDLGTVEVEDLVNTTVSYKDVNGVDVTTTVADLLSGITITIPAGTTYAPEFVFTIKDDNIYEISESLSMSVSNPTNATISTTASNATAVIDDEDDNNPDTPDDKKDGDKPVVSIVASDALAVEDTLNSTVAFKVSQSNLSNFDTTVLVKLDLGTVEVEDLVNTTVSYKDVNGVDVTTTVADLLSGITITIPAGTTYAPEFVFTIKDDNIYEISESLSMSVSNPTNATISTTASNATAVIDDEDDNNPDTPDDKKDGDKPVVSIVASDALAVEDTLNSTVAFKVSQSNLSNFDTTVLVKLDLGTVEVEDLVNTTVSYKDVNGVDVTTTVADLLSGITITIPAGTTYAPEFVFTIKDDNIYEISESLSMSVSNPTNATISTTASNATAVIDDEDDNNPDTPDDKKDGDKPVVSIVASDALAVEDTLNSTVAFKVSQSNLSNFDTTVLVKLDLGTVEVEDLVNTTVSYKDVNGVDVTTTVADLLSGITITIPAGTTYAPEFVFTIKDDNIYEISESLSMSVSNPTNATISTTASNATAVIDDEDDNNPDTPDDKKDGDKPVVSIVASDALAVEDTLNSTVAFKVSQSNLSNFDTTVLVKLDLGTVEVEDLVNTTVSYKDVNGVDVTTTVADLLSGITITIPAGTTYAPEFVFTIKDDNIYEISESLSMSVSNPTNATISTTASNATAVIDDEDDNNPDTPDDKKDGDKPVVSIVASDALAVEDTLNSTVAFKVSQSNLSNFDTTVLVKLDLGTVEVEDLVNTTVSYKDVNGVDVTTTVADLLSGITITIPAGTTYAPEFVFTIKDDNIYEISESLSMSVSNPTNATISTTASNATAVIDDEDDNNPDTPDDKKDGDKPVVSIVASDALAVEDTLNSTVAFKVSQSNLSNFDTTVLVKLDLGTVEVEDLVNTTVSYKDVNGVDVTTTVADLLSGITITIPAGTTYAPEFVFTIKDDNIYEISESLSMSVSNPTNATISTTASNATAVIDDEDDNNPDTPDDKKDGDKPVVSIVASDALAVEDTLNSTVAFKVSQSNLSNFDTTVLVKLDLGTVEVEDLVNTTVSYKDVNGVDVTTTVADLLSGITITIPAGTTYAPEFVFTIKDDNIYEISESLSMSVSNPTNATISTTASNATAVIDDEDDNNPDTPDDKKDGDKPVVSIVASDALAVEDTLNSTVAFKVSQSNLSNFDTTVLVKLDLGTVEVEDLVNTTVSYKDVNGVDVTTTVADLLSGITITIPAGTTYAPEFVFTIKDDNIYEISESLSMSVSNPTNATISTTASNATAVIDDEDDNNPDTPDDKKDGDKPVVSIVASDALAVEDTLNSTVAFKVSQSNLSNFDTTVLVKLDLGTVEVEDLVNTTVSYKDVNGVDVTTTVADLLSGITITIPAGTTYAPEFVFTIKDDNIYEISESLSMSVSNPTNATISTTASNATAVIDDEDDNNPDTPDDKKDGDKPVVSIVASDALAVEDTLNSTVAFKVSQSNLSNFDTTVLVKLDLGTVEVEDLVNTTVSYKDVNGVDVTTTVADLLSGITITIPAGTTYAPEFVFTIKDDNIYEISESLSMSVSNPTNATISTTASNATAVIDDEDDNNPDTPDDKKDGDKPVVSIVASDALAVEDTLNSTVAFKVSQSNLSNFDTTVLVKLDLGTVEVEDLVNTTVSYKDVNGVDVTTTVADLLSGITITIPAGTTYAPEFVFTIKDDNIYEISESLSMSVSNPTNATISTTASNATAVIDDEDDNNPDTPDDKKDGDKPVVSIVASDALAVEDTLNSTVAFKVSQSNLSNFDTTVLVKLDLGTVEVEDLVNTTVSYKDVNGVDVTTTVADLLSGITITIPAGTTYAPEFVFTIKDDNIYEISESLSMSVSNPTNATISTTASNATAVIDDEDDNNPDTPDDKKDGDKPVVSIVASDALAVEDTLNSTVAFKVSQSNLSNFDTTVLVKLDLGTVEVEDLVNTTVSYKDVNGVDVTTTVADLLSGITITIPAGTTYAPEFVFTIKDDNIYEISESLSMSVSNPTNATISTTASNATAVIDDEDDNNPDTPDDKKDGDKPVVSIVASDALAVEDTLNSTVAFKVSQSNLSNFDTTVLVKLDLGTVEVEDLVNTTVSYKDVNGVDVTTTVADLLSGITITIPAGTTYAPEFVFTIKDDNIYEISESLSMSVSNPTNATISTTASNATAVIDDEDDNNPDTPDDKKDGDKPVVSIVASDALAVEDTLNSTVAFKVSQSNLSNFDTTVLVKLDLGTVEVEDLVNTTVSYKDVNGVDVTTTVADLLSGITITIPAGTTYAPEFVFTIKDDNIYEISESLSMSVSNPTNATISTTASNATAVIDDEDDNNPDTPDDKKDGDKPVVSIVASDALAVEDTLNSTVAFKVSQSNLSNFDTTVLVKLDLGTVEVEDLVNTTVSYKDVNGVDVTTTVADLLSGITITIPAGTTYAPEFVFTIKDDNIYEISESLSMSVSNPTNATISTTASNATAVIDDEDDNNPDTPDDKKDGDKPVVSIVASDALAVEDTLNSTVAFKVSQSNLSNFDTTVLVKLDLGTVEVEDLVNTTVSYKDVNGVDVTTTVADLLSGITITIPAGTTYAPEFVFTIKDDNIYEISESLSMSVSNPTNATISTTASNATAVIDDEDDNNPDTPDDKKDGDKPVVSIVASDALAVEDTLNSTVAFKVSQSNLSNFDTTVLVKLDLGTVEVEDLVNTTVSYKDVNGVDVTTTVADLLSGITITIPAGTTYAPEFVFTIKDDNIYEISESLSMSVSNPTNATISTTASNATAVIDDEDDNNPDTPDDKKDGDKPVVSIVASDALAVEDTLNSTVAFKVSQSNLSNFDTTVLVKLDLGTVEVEDLVNTTVSYKDVNGVDVTTTVADLLSGITITIPAGTTYAPEFVFTIKDDNIYEISESLSMSVSNPTNATISTTASNATAVIDDEDDNNPDTPDDKKDGDKPVVSIVASDALAVEDTLNSTVAFKVSQSNLSNFDTTVLVKLDLGTVEVEDLVNTTVSYKDVNGVDVTTTVADLLSGITITIPAGTTYAPEFVFTIKDDNIYEISESLSMSVSNPTNATISTTASNATAVIDDEDDNNPDTPDDKKDGDKPVVSIVASDALAVEDTLNSTVAFKVSQSNLSNFDTTVLVKLDLGTVEVEDLVNTTVSYKDVNGVDVTTTVADLLSGITITIPAGTTYAPEFVFTIKDDNIYEISESLSMSVSNPTNATISTTASNATAVIDDEDDNNPDTPDDKKDGDKPVVSIVEDTTYVLTTNDFGISSYNFIVTTVRISALPTNGTLTLNGVTLIAMGAIINTSDVLDGKLVFTPNQNTDDDSNFKYEVSADNGLTWSTTSYTTSVNVIAVADTPIVNINVKSTITIDDTNVTETTGGYIVNAYHTKGDYTSNVAISTISNTDHDGFGVAGDSSGDYSEIGYNDTTKESEELVVSFGEYDSNGIFISQDVASANVSFAWKHQVSWGETAVVEFYRDGMIIGVQTYYGGSDGVDEPIKMQVIDTLTGELLSFDEIRFSSLGYGDDYLIHSITYQEVESNINGKVINYLYDVDISAALTDTDGSESLKVQISGVPTGATFNTTDITDLGNGIWELTIPANATSVNTTYEMKIPATSSQDFDLKVIATSTEANDSSSTSTEILFINDDTIDLANFSSNTSYKSITDVVDMTNTKTNTMSIDINDIVDLVDGDNQLVIKGDLEDKVTLDTPSDWTKAGQESLNGTSYNVYTGTGVNSTIKLLIEDEIDVKPDI